MLSASKCEPAKGGRFFDWALTPLSDLMMNQLPSTMQRQGSHLIWKVRQFSLDATWFASEPVLLMCGSSGVKHGRLVPEPSRILISSGSVFVTAYMIELSKDGALSDGDSGSWVISENTQDLLGHIVATDALGTGYFIPAEDIFNVIIQNSLALAVTLLTVKDIRLKRNEVRGGVKTMETKGKDSDSGKSKQASGYTYFDGLESIETFADTERGSIIDTATRLEPEVLNIGQPWVTLDYVARTPRKTTRSPPRQVVHRP